MYNNKLHVYYRMPSACRKVGIYVKSEMRALREGKAQAQGLPIGRKSHTHYRLHSTQCTRTLE